MKGAGLTAQPDRYKDKTVAQTKMNFMLSSKYSASALRSEFQAIISSLTKKV